MKVCPVCKSRCFDDMDTCYGCLHDFTKDNKTSIADTQKIKIPDVEHYHIPEYFELDTFPYIEEKDSFRVRGAHEKIESKDSEKIKITFEIPKDILKKYIVQ